MMPDNRSGVVRGEWGGAMRRLRLAIGELEELQEATGVGAFTLTQRLAANDWRVADVRETIRLGLIGGGMGVESADRLIDSMSTMDLRLGVPVAIIVLAAALTGSPEEQQFKRAHKSGGSGPELPEGRLRFGSFYRAAGAIGVSVADMRTMTLWQFNEVVDGFVESKTDGKDAGLSQIEEDQLGALLAAPI
ncbi:gene transfer agent family protein [Bosea sp. FBZP-16]|uniref:gene transfer agent family protein n=1 Tax=Bosea sp. FBZP-16 TaxID=2065382 RepID=UPI000C317201|nr:gene transfer agent family protein [Bosea sp. FBZP-16]